MTYVEERRDRFVVTTDPSRIDARAVHAYLEQSYWAAGIPLSVVERAIARSLCFSVLDGDRQIGFARVVTDAATFAYLCDVYVLEEYRGYGLGEWLIRTVAAHPDLQGLRRFLLMTRDAHGLYAKVGFALIARPERCMEIVRPDIYKNAGHGGGVAT
jgi:GNAT superfamily N-acetyltransferase